MEGVKDNLKYTIGSIMSIVIPLLHIIAAWRFGDWKNWRKYYPTILFAIVVDIITNIVTYDHTLWLFHRSYFLPNHTVIDLMIAFVILPTTVLLFLTHYPNEYRKLIQVTYITIWIVFEFLVECGFSITNMISYHNRWSLWWSGLLWVIMIPVFRLHHTKPLLAIVICIGVAVSLMNYFDISITHAK